MSLLINKKSENKIAEVTLKNNKKIVSVYSLIVFYGTEANDEISQRICKDIENAWNIQDAHTFINDIYYKVKFRIEGICIQNIDKKIIYNNKYTWKKFYRIEDYSPKHISFADAIFSNTGFFLKKNIIKPNSMTGPHEIGHNWGLEHPDEIDIRGYGQPHIMFPRGTIVDPEFRYNPNAEARIVNNKWVLEDGCTLNTDKRKVTQKNIDDLNLNKLNFIKNKAELAKLTNKYHPKYSSNM